MSNAPVPLHAVHTKLSKAAHRRGFFSPSLHAHPSMLRVFALSPVILPMLNCPVDTEPYTQKIHRRFPVIDHN
ncbi:hypothetical protein BCAR13_510025 [Paraburkholderia caribensis]|nr:hypothetical protein BCAR13_510025 [Paraburkholderia caribensis]